MRLKPSGIPGPAQSRDTGYFAAGATSAGFTPIINPTLHSLQSCWDWPSVPLETQAQMGGGGAPLARSLGTNRHRVGIGPRLEGRAGDWRQGPDWTDAIGPDGVVGGREGCTDLMSHIDEQAQEVHRHGAGLEPCVEQAGDGR